MRCLRNGGTGPGGSLNEKTSAAAASRAVGEREVRVGVVIRRSTCRANRRARRGAFGQGRPVCRCGIGHSIDLFPTGLRPRSLNHGAEQGERQK